jgi:hypothetical protein
MRLRDIMQMRNITSDETSSVDVGGKWLDPEMCHVGFRFTEDDEEDVEFHMLLDRADIEVLREFFNDILGTQPGKLN